MEYNTKEFASQYSYVFTCLCCKCTIGFNPSFIHLPLQNCVYKDANT